MLCLQSPSLPSRVPTHPQLHLLLSPRPRQLLATLPQVTDSAQDPPSPTMGFPHQVSNLFPPHPHPPLASLLLPQLRPLLDPRPLGKGLLHPTRRLHRASQGALLLPSPSLRNSNCLRFQPRDLRHPPPSPTTEAQCPLRVPPSSKGVSPGLHPPPHSLHPLAPAPHLPPTLVFLAPPNLFLAAL